MGSKRLFLLQGVVLVLGISTLANLINSVVSESKNNTSVAIALTILISVCLFLALFNYEAVKTPRQIEWALMKKLENSWIQSLLDLERSLPGTMSREFSITWVEKSGDGFDLGEKTALRDAFEVAEGSLLVVGESGEGKTVSLLRLAKALLQEARDDPKRGIPVVLNLSSLGGEPLEVWLIRELNARYDLAEEVSRAWLLERRFILLLDSLDEAEPCARCFNEKKSCECCLKSINDFLPRKLMHGIAVATSNNSDFPHLKRTIKVEITVSKDGPRQSYTRQPDVVGQLTNAESLGPAFHWKTVLRRLHWLAKTSQKKYQGHFTIAQIQPSWLEFGWLKVLYVVLSRATGAAVVMGLGYLLLRFSNKVLLWVSNDSHATIPKLFDVEANGGWWFLTTVVAGGVTTAALDLLHMHYASRLNRGAGRVRKWLVGLTTMLLYIGAYLPVFYFVARYKVAWPRSVLGAAVFAISFGLVFWFRARERTLSNDSHTADKLVWSRAQIGVGLIYGLVGGVISGLLLWWAEPFSAERFSKPHVMGLLVLIGPMVGAIAGGLMKVSIIEQTSTNQDLRTALRSTILIWLSVGTPTVLLIWGYAAVYMTPERAVGAAVFYGLVAGLLCGFAYSGFDLVYRSIFRFILWITRKAPLLEWTRFLDYSASLGFLRKVGGGYTFFHRQLRDDLAKPCCIESLKQALSQQLRPNNDRSRESSTAPHAQSDGETEI